MKNHGVHFVPSGKWSGVPGSCVLMYKKYFLKQKYALEGFYKDFTLLGLSDIILWFNEVDGTCNMCLLTALRSAS